MTNKKAMATVRTDTSIMRGFFPIRLLLRVRMTSDL
jgi:hypothetical protein